MVCVGGMSKGQKKTFSEYGHVAYQIKGNDECSKMVANILPADRPLSPHPPTLGVWSKSSFFRIMVMVHIKLKGMTHAAKW